MRPVQGCGSGSRDREIRWKTYAFNQASNEAPLPACGEGGEVRDSEKIILCVLLIVSLNDFFITAGSLAAKPTPSPHLDATMLKHHDAKYQEK